MEEYIMADYKIFTDSGADLPPELIKKYDIGMVSLHVSIDGKDYLGKPDFPIEEFYNRLRKGSTATTSQVTESTIREEFEPVLKSGTDILYLAFSSGLSATADGAKLTAAALMSEYPGRTVMVVDTLCASLGQGLLILKCVEQKAKGLSLQGVADYAVSTLPNVVHLVVADDLMHLKRGGRISAAAAVAGSLLGVKPLIHMNEEGKLIPIGKERGKERAMDKLLDMMGERMKAFDNQYMTICHADCIEDAQYIAKEAKRRFGVKNAVIYYIGTVIGAHTGPGTVAFFFLGDKR
jgi:DegV family protein with EDD domain